MVKCCCWQTEREVQDHISQLQEELQRLKDRKQLHTEQQRDQVGTHLPMSMDSFTVAICSLSRAVLLTGPQHTLSTHSHNKQEMYLYVSPFIGLKRTCVARMMG